MHYGMYLSAAGVSSAQHTQATISNNLANVETVGFKRAIALFAEAAPAAGLFGDPGKDVAGQAPMLDHMTGGRLIRPTVFDGSQGVLEASDNPLDLALFGDGYLRVERDGQSHLTRDGRLALDPGGRLVLAATPDVAVLGEDGRPIVLGPRSPDTLLIDDGGGIRDRLTGEPLGQLGLTGAENARPIGGNLFAAARLAPIPTATRVQSGYVERSNVDPTVELTRLIEAARLLETNANLLRSQDTALGKLIEAGRIG